MASQKIVETIHLRGSFILTTDIQLIMLKNRLPVQNN